MRDIVETELRDISELTDVKLRLDRDSDSKFSQPDYRDDQEQLIIYTVKGVYQGANLIGNIQLEIYLEDQFRSMGDRYLMRDYFAENTFVD
jgi:hypothetical protein